LLFALIGGAIVAFLSNYLISYFDIPIRHVNLVTGLAMLALGNLLTSSLLSVNSKK